MAETRIFTCDGCGRTEEIAMGQRDAKHRVDGWLRLTTLFLTNHAVGDGLIACNECAPSFSKAAS